MNTVLSSHQQHNSLNEETSWGVLLRISKGDQGMVRSLNRRLILNHLRQAGPTSRARLADITGLSPAAVTGVTAELIQDHFLLEHAVGESSGGRPPILLDIDYKAHCVVGLKLMETKLEAVLTDLSTEVLEHISLALTDLSPEGVATQAFAVTKDLFRQARINRQRLIGLGLGLAGVIDAARGVCVSSPYLGWQQTPIGVKIRDKIKVPVWLDNDVNAFAAAERLFGHGKSAENFVVVTVGRGIGMGLVLGGELYRGRNGGAGEFGHTVSEAGGRCCECGNHGCLEAYAAEPALVARYNERAGQKPVSDIHGLLKRVALQDALALELLEDAGCRVGRGLATVVNLLNPEAIIIGGEGVRLGDAFFAPMQASLLEHSFNGLASNLPVFIDAWGDDAWARGAASLAVQRAFDLGSIRGG
jgi:predicted NBD/HSP70 family sugar kinase